MAAEPNGFVFVDVVGVVHELEVSARGRVVIRCKRTVSLESALKRLMGKALPNSGLKTRECAKKIHTFRCTKCRQEG
jgi:hypothetical protein